MTQYAASIPRRHVELHPFLSTDPALALGFHVFGDDL